MGEAARGGGERGRVFDHPYSPGATTTITILKINNVKTPCQKKDCFTKYVVKDLEKQIAVGKDEEFATLREQLTEILDSEIHRRSSDGSYGNELSSQSSLKDNKGSSGGLKKSPWSATQVERCTRNGGKCINQKIDSCVGEIVNNLCPGDYRWKCCVD